MANTIKVKFEAQGARAMVSAINQLSVAQERLNGNNAKAERLQAKLNRQVEEYNKKGIFGVRNNRNIAGSFSVLRSQLLLVSFGFGLLNKSVLKLGKAYGVQEAAEKKLAGLLGKSSKALSLRASTLQKVTRFGDEETIGAMSLVAAYTTEENAIARLVQSAQDLATVKGMDLNTATDMLAKSVFSSTNSMSRYGVSIEGTAGTSERLESAIRAINTQMGGAAQDDAETYLGAIDQMNNSVGDLAEKMGEILAPAIIFISKRIKDFSDSIDTKTIKEYGFALTVVGGVYLTVAHRAQLAALATLTFGKAMRLSGVGLAIAGVAALAEHLKLFGDESEDAKKLADELSASIGDGSGKVKDDIIARRESFDLRTEEILLEMRQNDLLDKQASLMSDGLTDRNEIIEAEEQLALAFAEKNRFEQKSLDNLLTEKEERDKNIIRMKLHNKEIQAQINLRQKEVALVKEGVKSAMDLGASYDHAGKAASAAAREVINSKIKEVLVNYLAGMFAKVPFPANLVLAAASGAAISSILQKGFDQLATVKFEQGGYVGGRRHSQGGTIIEAERGEFVMSRNAVESIGVNNLEAMNAGGGAGITVNISGNVMSEQFVEEELAERISEAVRKGADFGLMPMSFSRFL